MKLLYTSRIYTFRVVVYFVKIYSIFVILENCIVQATNLLMTPSHMLLIFFNNLKPGGLYGSQ